MGGFYGSVQIRSTDREWVRAVGEEIAKSMKIKLLLGPALEGWIGVYPEGGGQDDGVGRKFAQRIGGYAMHLMVHDDSIFAYWLYRDGRLIDSYWSAPGYFDEEDKAEQEKMAGDPDAFRPLVGDCADELHEVLDRENAPIFSYEQLDAFAKVVGIPNAVASYEYLKNGERDDIQHWEEFEELPAEAVRKEKEQRREADDRLKRDRQKLQDDGLLLLRDEREDKLPVGCALADCFLVAWPDLRRQTVSFSKYRRPWKRAEPMELQTPPHLLSIFTDGARRYVGMSTGKNVQVWDSQAEPWQLIAEIGENDLSMSAALSSDGSLVAHLSRQSLNIASVASGQQLLSCAAQGFMPLAFHPSGEWIAAGGGTLGLVAIHEEPHWRDLFIGGKLQPMNVAATTAMMRASTQKLDFDMIEKQSREQMEKMIETMRKQNARSKNPAMTEEMMTNMREQMEKSLAVMREKMAAFAEGRMPEVPPQSSERLNAGTVGFSRDGRWLWCGTHKGLRVYEWSKVPRSNDAEMPAPTCSFDCPGESSPLPMKWIHAVAEEMDAPALAFGGSTGRLYRLDLKTGKTRELLKLPGNCGIHRLAMSADGESLGMASHTMPRANSDTEQDEQLAAWEIYSYSRMRSL
jgi:hypothetical protein